jgi:hypothetical protein
MYNISKTRYPGYMIKKETKMTKLYEYILAQDDPFDFIYEALSGTHGVETMNTCTVQ